MYLTASSRILSSSLVFSLISPSQSDSFDEMKISPLYTRHVVDYSAILMARTEGLFGKGELIWQA